MASSTLPFGADRITNCLSGWSTPIVFAISIQSWKVMYWLARKASLSKYSYLICRLSSSISLSIFFSSSESAAIFSRYYFIYFSLSCSFDSPIHRIVFFWVFSTYPMPYSTFVISYIRLFCTFNRVTALLRSSVWSGDYLINSTNFLVNTDRLLSCRPLPKI